MRKDEVFAKQQFHKFLLDVPSENVSWRDGNQNVSPDFYLSIGQSNYVVEVTTLIEHIQTPRKNVTRLTIEDSADRIIAEVKQATLKKGILSGIYYVSFSGIEVDFYAVRKQLKKELIKFIDRTQVDKSFVSTDISIDSVTYCRVQKSKTPGADVSVGFYPISTKWEGESNEEACDFLQTALSGKSKCLAKFSQPKILLLLADYGFVEPAGYAQCVSTLNNLNDFHTVFIVAVRQPSKHFLLHTIESNWK